ncbi:MAG: LPS biosynthesis protein [Armatimonadetes bacterium]|nr:LPS biosynthesis protein [Armatimonadota bacterium]
MVDGHELEKKAMELFRAGRGAEATKLQDEFLALVKASGEDYCTCPHGCKFHGKCVECVILHRGHADHLPHCFRAMVNERIGLLSALTEHSARQ